MAENTTTVQTELAYSTGFETPLNQVGEAAAAQPEPEPAVPVLTKITDPDERVSAIAAKLIVLKGDTVPTHSDKEVIQAANMAANVLEYLLGEHPHSNDRPHASEPSYFVLDQSIHALADDLLGGFLTQEQAGDRPVDHIFQVGKVLIAREVQRYSMPEGSRFSELDGKPYMVSYQTVAPGADGPTTVG